MHNNRKLRSISFFVFLSIAISCLSQINKSLPKWIVNENIHSIGNINVNEVKDGYYFLLIDEQYNRVEKHNYFHYAIKTTSEAGLSYASQIEISYDPSFQKAFIHFIRIHRGNEIIDKTNKEEIKTLIEENERSIGILNGNKTIYANLSDLRKGDIVEYSYSIIGYNPIFQNYFNYDFNLSYSVPVGRIFNRLIFPKSEAITILKLHTDINPAVKPGINNDYVWEINNPKIRIIENNVPSWYNPYSRVQISNIKSWLDVKKIFNDLFKVETYDKTQLSAIADSIKNQFPNNVEDQISASVDFVQNHIRYSGNENGIYSHKPHSPEYVIKNRFGDCKDKSLFLIELLNYFNVKSYPVLLNTSLKSTIDNESPSLEAFNHCIAVINYQNKLYFIDPTIIFQKGSFKTRTIPNYEKSIVLDNSEKVFYQIPISAINKINLVENIEIEENGDATLKVESIYTGENADNVRYYFGTNSLNDIQENYKSIYFKYTGDIKVIDTVTFKDYDSVNEFRTYETYLLKGFWSGENSVDKNAITKDFMPFTLNEKLIYVNDKNRNDPLKINHPFNVRQIINIRKKEGWNITNNTTTENNKFFNYQLIRTINEELLCLDYSYESKTDLVEPKDYLLYKSKMDFLDSNLIFSVTQNTTNDIQTEGFNWLLFISVIVTIIISIFVCIELNKKKIENLYFPKYNSINGWLILMAIGLVISPISLLIQVIRQIIDEINVNYYSAFFNESSASYEPLKAYYLIGVNVFNVFLVVSSIYITIIFFQRKAAFRKYYAYFKFFNLGFITLNLIIGFKFFYDGNSLEEKVLLYKEYGNIFRVLLQTCIWVPYIWYSERSRHTFTKTSMIMESTDPDNTIIVDELDPTMNT